MNLKSYTNFLLEKILPKSFRKHNLLYHSTTFENFIKIMKENTLWENIDYDFGVSTSRNRNYIFGIDEDGNVLKNNGEIQIILDKIKLQHNYKIKAFDWENYKQIPNDNYHQSEDKIHTTIKNLDKYIIGFHINKNDVNIPEGNINIIDYLKKWDYFIEKYNNFNWSIFDKNWNIIQIN